MNGNGLKVNRTDKMVNVIKNSKPAPIVYSRPNSHFRFEKNKKFQTSPTAHLLQTDPRLTKNPKPAFLLVLDERASRATGGLSRDGIAIFGGY